jgi:hypothetical protein
MPYSKTIKIIRNTFGRVAVSTRSIPKGYLVRVMDGYTVPYPTKTSIRLGDERHMEDNVGRFINHSCSPTLRVDIERAHLWANKDILPNMPLTFDYLASEKTISSPFMCIDCGLWVPREGGCDNYK